MANRAESTPHGLNVGTMGVKRQVQVGAHVSAQVIQDSRGKLLEFSERSVFAGKVLTLPGCYYSGPAGEESCGLMPFFNESHLIAQPLG